LAASVIQLILGIILAVVAIYIALKILDKMTKGIDEFKELDKGNVAVALEMAGVIIAVVPPSLRSHLCKLSNTYIIAFGHSN
jgi:uncharacterized membrane protein YjfL (UPF0719 family)